MRFALLVEVGDAHVDLFKVKVNDAATKGTTMHLTASGTTFGVTPLPTDVLPTDLDKAADEFRYILGLEGTIGVLGIGTEDSHEIAVLAYRHGWTDAVRNGAAA